MSDISLEQTEPQEPLNTGAAEPGELRVGEKPEPDPTVMPVPTAELEVKIAAPQGETRRAGTIEHLAARRLAPSLDAEAPEVKQRLNELRPELTALVTDLRWGGASTQETAESIIPLLNVGSLQQWAPLL